MAIEDYIDKADLYYEEKKMSKETYTVAWSMPSEKIIKLVEPDKTYAIADKVHTYLEGQGLYDKLDDKKVVVEIDETLDQDGNQTITNLKLADDKTTVKKEEPKKEEVKQPEATSDSVVKELTVAGVSVKNKAVTFKEEEKVWYTLGDAIDAEDFKLRCTKKKIEAVIVATEKGNDIVETYVLREEQEEVKEEKPKVTGQSYKNEMQNSIEAQASMNSANRVVQALVDKDSKAEDVLKMITKISEHNFKTIQDLKNKG